MLRRGLWGWATLCIGLVGCAPPPADPPPDVVLVVLDTLRRDALRLAGQGDNPTPGLDALAREAVVFEQAHSTHDATPPSHFSLFTGLRDGLGGPLDAVENSLARQLRSVGYRTLGVSANGNVAPAAMRSAAGFDRFVNLMDAYDALPSAERSARDAETQLRLDRYGAPASDFNRRILASGAAEVLRALRENALPRDRPRFVFLNFIDVHDPFFPDRTEPPEEAALPGFESDLRARSLPAAYADPSRFDAEEREDFLRRKANVFGGVWRIAWDLEPQELARYRDRYRAEVRELDAALAPLWTWLDAAGLLDGVLVVTSDHGECFGEAGYVTHSFSNRGDWACSTHVPLLIRAPGVVPGRIEHPVTIADVVPTLYDLIGLDDAALREADAGYGRSLLPWLGRSPGPARGAVQVSRRQAAPDAIDREARERLRALGYVE